MKYILTIILSAIMTLNQFNIAVTSFNNNTIEEYDYTLKFGETSESGYSEPYWVDDEGNVVDELTASTDDLSGTDSALPSYYSSADEGYVSSIKNQGVFGTCWSFSMMGAAESNALVKGLNNGEEFDFSEAHHVWFTHKSYIAPTSEDKTSGDGNIVSDPYQAGGNYLRSTFSLARGSGFAYESDFPFDNQDESKMGNYKESSRYISEYYLKNVNVLSGRDDIKNAIINNGSVSAAYFSDTSYYNFGNDGTCYIYGGKSTSTNHQIIIVGWDDDFSRSNFDSSCRPSSDGAWLVKNSYGKRWGDNGYFWLSYEEPTLANAVSVDIDKSDFYNDIYQYDGYGYTKGSSWSVGGVPSKDAFMSNVFTAKKDETLNAVSFYTLQGNVDYKVYIYTDLKDNYSTPVDGGKCVYEKSGSITHQGYHVIDIDEPVDIVAGEKFSVVIEIKNSEKAIIAFEGASDYTDPIANRKYYSESGQSYYKGTVNSAWTACSTAQNNVCVKAFASSSNTLEISNKDELIAFSNEVNSGNDFDGFTVTLTDDIDLTGIDFTPIGNNQNFFNGIFDGAEHIIKNMTVKDYKYSGLFGYTGSKSVIKNLGIENCNVTGEYIGAIAGQSNSSKIYHCYCTGSANGIVGYCNGTSISSCYSLCEKLYSDGYGAFLNCFVLNCNGEKGITMSSLEEFANGKVAFDMSNDDYKWTKGESYPQFSKGNDDVYRVNVINVVDDNSFFIYTTKSENANEIISDKFTDVSVKVYTDYSCENPFSGKVTYSRNLFVCPEYDEYLPAGDSVIVLSDSYITNLYEGMTCEELYGQFKNKNIVVTDENGNPLDREDYVHTGCKVQLLVDGEVVKELETILYGDVNGDGWIDSIDEAVCISFVNYEIDEDYLGGARYRSLDVSHDGVVDEVDVVLLDLACMFISEIEQNYSEN